MRKLATILLTAALLLTGMTFLYEGAEAGATGSAPGTPVGVGGVGYIDVSWSPASGSPSQYYVYWGTVNGSIQISGFPTTVGGTTSHVTTSGSPDFSTPLPPGYTLYFQICADYGGSYTYSEWSAPVTTVDHPGTPTNLQASVSNGNVALSWSAPADDGGASIANYTVHRGTVSGALTQIASLPGSSLSYLDDSVAGGQTYYYALAAYNGYNSALTNEITVTLPAGKPGVTQNLQCAPGVDNMTLTWSAPSGDGGSAITDYRIYRSTVSGDELLIGSTGGTNLSYVDRAVTVGETYYYQVAAVNSLGESGRGSEVSIKYIAPPNAPRNLQGAAVPGEVKLTWEIPVDDGSSPIVWYDIYRNNVTAGDGWTWLWYTEGDLYFNDTDVQEGCTYQYEISAWNEDNVESVRSDTVEVRCSSPSEPLNITASALGKGGLVVSWDAPGTSDITGYVIYWGTSPGPYTWNRTCSADDVDHHEGGLSIMLGGLDDGTQYHVTVAAVNAIGTGPAGTPASATTSAGPGPVMNLGHYNNGPGKINVFWGPPSGYDPSDLTKYTIYRGTSLDSMTFLSDVPTNRTGFFDQGLQDGVTYYYRVTATDSIGEGAPATVSGKCGNPPSEPQDLTAVGGLNNITLTWEQPSYTGGGITGYYLYRCATTDGQYTLLIELDGSTTRYVDMVGQNKTWFYKLFAGSSMGAGEFSGAASASSYAPPGAPTMVSAEPGDGTVHLTWEAPGFEGRPSIAGYHIYRGTSPSAMAFLYDAGLSFEYSDAGLTNGNVYYYAVLAYSSDLSSSLSGIIEGSPGTTPSEPVLLPAKAGDSYVNVSWLPVANNGGRTITAYELYRLEGDVIDWSTKTMLISTTSVLEFNDTSVVNGHSYTYFVIALNELGSSGHGPMLTCVPCHVPDVPSDLKVEGGREIVHLEWTAPADMGGGVQHYLIYRGLTPESMALLATIGNQTSYADIDVIVGTMYYYSVSASNWAGEGSVCAPVGSSTIYWPSAPSNVVAAPDISEIHLTWGAPADDGNAAIGYRVYRSTSGGAPALIAELSGTDLAYDDVHVVAGVQYSYQVSAFNAAYEGERSVEVKAVPYNAPSAPRDVALAGGTKNVTVTWSAPSNDNGSAVLGYKVLIRSAGNSYSAQFDAGLTYRFVIGGLSNDLTYVLSVVAYNLAGDGVGSEEMQARTLAAPSAATIGVSAGNAWANISWTVPSSDAPITGYNIYRGTGAGSMALLKTVGTMAYFNDTSVVNGQAYYYSVSAISQVGEGIMSDAVPAIPFRAPDAPSGLEANAGVGYVALSWSSPDDGGAPVSGYNVYRGSAEGSMTWLAVVLSNGYNDTGVMGGESYRYRIVAVNAGGEGAPAEISATALFPPPAPTNLKVTRGGEGAIITWEMPSPNSTTAPATGFAIYRQVEGGEFVLIAVVNGSDARSFTDDGAPEGTAVYRVATLSGGVTAGARSMSQSFELSASDIEWPVLLVAAIILAGLMVLFILSFRRKDM